jgi:hypothetical protein
MSISVTPLAFFFLLIGSRGLIVNILIKLFTLLFFKEVLEISVFRGDNKFSISFYRDYREYNLFRILIIVGAYSAQRDR